MAKKVKKKELGKGIRALLSDIDNTPEEEKDVLVRELANSIATIPLDLIDVNPYQPRNEFDIDALNELASSIKVHGLIQPITVRRISNNSYQLISGERRLRASKLSGLKEIPAYIRIANDQELLEMALIENIQRENLNAIEVSISYQRLMDECDLTHEKLSERIGKNRSTVTNYLRLLKLPPEVQDSIKNKKLSMGHARALVGVADPALQLMLHKQIVDEGLSVRAVENLIRKFNEPSASKNKKKNVLPIEYQKVSENLTEVFGTKVDIKLQSKGKGQIIINFGSTDELNRIIDLTEDIE